MMILDIDKIFENSDLELEQTMVAA
jgi:hypothetical protein